MRILLDKNIVRFALVALRLRSERTLTSREFGALTFIQHAHATNASLFITDTTHNILQTWGQSFEVQTLLAICHILYPTRYHKRWARRIRETSGLSREDCAILAFGTFATNFHGSLLGTDVVATYDQALVNGFAQHKTVLTQRLQRMTRQLHPPFLHATLPHVANPTQIIL